MQEPYKVSYGKGKRIGKKQQMNKKCARSLRSKVCERSAKNGIKKGRAETQQGVQEARQREVHKKKEVRKRLQKMK